MQLRASTVAAATRGVLRGDDVIIDGASIDSRSIEPGQLFVPIVAERNGHDYIASALEHGAVAYLTSEPEIHAGTAIEVADTLEALTALGKAARAQLPHAVVGITGSVGKTSVKDLTAAALAPSRATHASDRSFNNEMGVPLTLLNTPGDTEVAIVEMGARGVGHIAHLCSIAQPTVGVVTNVGAVHTSEFGDVDTVARAKGELIEAVPTDGTAVLNADDARVLAMKQRTSARTLTFGTDADSGADVRAERVVVDDDLRTRFTVVTPAGNANVALAVRGGHQVQNALAAVTIGIALGVDLESMASGLGDAALSPWRMEVGQAESGATIINDAYNANTLSVTAALDSLAAAPAKRRIAVLGVMAELGDRHDADHAEMTAYARQLGIEVIAFDEAAYGAATVHSIDEAAGALADLGPDDAVLIKGSRVAGLERLAARLIGS